MIKAISRAAVPALLMTGATLPATAADVPAPHVNAAICRNLATYAPDPGVTYQPGVDVHGHPVAPADLPGSEQPPLNGVTLPLYGAVPGVASAGKGQAAPGGFAVGQGGAGQTYLGTIQLNGNQVLLNGKPVQADTQARLAAACRAQGFTP